MAASVQTDQFFLMTDWREGRRAAFAMGVKHGAYCTGCCWFLMALLSVVVLLEKAVPKGAWLGRLIGLLLAAWGVEMIVTRAG